MSDDPEAERPHEYSLKPGAILGGHEILRALGHGGVGEVYVAKKVSTGRTVALKILLRKFVEDTYAVSRLRKEAAFLVDAKERVKHPSIPEIFDQGFDEALKIHFIAIEFFEGCSLEAAMLKREAQEYRVPVNNAVDIVIQLLGAIELLHKIDIVHRDLKPANIHLVEGTERDHIKLLDFGVAKGAGTADLSLTRTGTMVGTPYYMAPEQFKDSKTAGAPADVWAAGVILYQLLAGHPPFHGSDFAALMYATCFDAYYPLEKEIPAELGNVIEAVLNKDPAQRYTASQFKTALQALHYPPPTESLIPRKEDENQPVTLAPPALGSSPLSGTNAEPAPVVTQSGERHGRISKRHKVAFGVLGATSLCAVATIIVSLSGRTQTTMRPEPDSSFQVPPPITPVTQLDAGATDRDAASPHDTGSRLRLAASRDAGTPALSVPTVDAGRGADAQPDRSRGGHGPRRPRVRHIATPPTVRCHDVVVNGLHRQQCDD